MKKRAPEESISRLLDTIGKSPRILILMAIGEGEACVCHLEADPGVQTSLHISEFDGFTQSKITAISTGRAFCLLQGE